MATIAPISVSEYKNTTYRPDQEFLEGQLIERNVGEYDHSNLQGALIGLIGTRQREWNIRVLPAQRVQVSPTRFRIPDVCVVSREQAVEPVFTRPPLLCIEVLSKDDSLRSMQDRIDDYRAFSVPNIWVLDPVKRCAYVCSHGDFREPDSAVLEIPGSPIRVTLAELFAELD